MSAAAPEGEELPNNASRSLLPRLAWRDPSTVRPHPAYVGLLNAVPASESVAELPVPVLVTTGGILIAGFDRWQRAVRVRDEAVLCLEYELSEDAALEWCVRLHATPAVLNDYCRIRLALELEPIHRASAASRPMSNKQFGASKLTTCDRSDVRRRTARIAGVSTGNVTKVKQLQRTIAPELEAALRDGRISIHRAWQLSQLPREHQGAAFLDRRNHLAVDRAIQQLARRHVLDRAKRIENDATMTPSDVLTTLASSETQFSVVIMSVPCLMVAISQGR